MCGGAMPVPESQPARRAWALSHPRCRAAPRCESRASGVPLRPALSPLAAAIVVVCGLARPVRLRIEQSYLIADVGTESFRMRDWSWWSASEGAAAAAGADGGADGARGVVRDGGGASERGGGEEHEQLGGVGAGFAVSGGEGSVRDECVARLGVSLDIVPSPLGRSSSNRRSSVHRDAGRLIDASDQELACAVVERHPPTAPRTALPRRL